VTSPAAGTRWLRSTSRHSLVKPACHRRRQALRSEPGRKTGYLDAEFDLPDGTVVAIEVDGSVHVQPMAWWDDTSRQNELVIGGRPVLRYPSLMIRLEPQAVVDQLRRINLAHQCR